MQRKQWAGIVEAMADFQEMIVQYQIITGRSERAAARHMRRLARLGAANPKRNSFDYWFFWRQRYLEGWASPASRQKVALSKASRSF